MTMAENTTEQRRFMATFAVFAGFSLVTLTLWGAWLVWPWLVKAWFAYRALRWCAGGALYAVAGSAVLALMVQGKPHLFAGRGAQMNYPMTVCVFFLWPLAVFSLLIQLAIAPARVAFEAAMAQQQD